MNAKILLTLAKNSVKFHEKIGINLTLEKAMEIEAEKLKTLIRENDYPY